MPGIIDAILQKIVEKVGAKLLEVGGSYLFEKAKNTDWTAVKNFFTGGNYFDKKKHSSILLLAVSQNNYEAAELLIKRGADVNVLGNNDITPLMIAIYKGNKEIAELLIKNGADINAKSNTNETPLRIAISEGNVEILKLLVDKGAKLESIKELYKVSALTMAIGHGKKEVIEYLVKNGFDINEFYTNNMTPLMYAIMTQKDENFIKFMIDSGADVNAKNKIGATALSLAVELNKPSIVKALLDNGAKNRPDIFTVENSFIAFFVSMITTAIFLFILPVPLAWLAAPICAAAFIATLGVIYFNDKNQRDAKIKNVLNPNKSNDSKTLKPELAKSEENTLMQTPVISKREKLEQNKQSKSAQTPGMNP